MTNLPVVQSYFTKRGEPRSNLRIFLQDEHNLVLPGGRGVRPSCPQGVVPSIFGGDEKYFVRVDKERKFRRADVILEYNVPNVVNIKSSGKFSDQTCDRIVYCPSIPFDYSNVGDRSIDVLTNIINTEEPRRARLIEKLDAFQGYRNVQGIYDLPSLRSLYQSAKIVVNPHQTWHHHSIEEFRILPALSQGCLIVSEDVPLRTHIPYHEYVIWCRYEDIPEIVADTLQNYDQVLDRMHGPDSGLELLLQRMLAEFEQSMDSVIAADANRSSFSRFLSAVQRRGC
ncbi:hypothetical protein ACVDG8_020370 [Mesorhizobium sp. ORM8.1]